jgi:general secretion pathway protein G
MLNVGEQTMHREPRPHAFTLVEILIVVVILGVLAAIVLPQFAGATAAARSSNTDALLHTLRSQVELYRAEHNDEAPTLAQLWTVMVSKTDINGNVDPNGRYGPYLVREPQNIFTNSVNVVAAGAATANDGWEYDETNGYITAVGYDEATNTYTSP